MTPTGDELSQVLGCFQETTRLETDSKPRQVSGGFSGSSVWRLRNQTGDWAVRLWPAGYSADRLTWIHQVLSGLPKTLPVPIPLRTKDGQTFVARANSLWSLEPWMPGQASYWSEPSNKKLTEVMRELAAFHAAAELWATGPQLVPAIGDRIAALQQHADALREYESAIEQESGELAELCREVFTAAKSQILHWQRALSAVETTRTVLLPCIRDLWHDHVLYTGDRVTGLIDFGGMRLDSIATDLARLIGSLVGCDQQLWRFALDEYRLAKRLPESEARLIEVIDGSSQCIAGLNWVRWLLVERRIFENRELVHERIRRILSRLQPGRVAKNG